MSTAFDTTVPGVPTLGSESLDEDPVVSTGMDVLREKRAEAAKRQTIDLSVGGYDGALVARYRLLDPLKEGKEIGERVRRQFKGDEDAQLFYANADTLIEACVGLYLRDDNGELEPIDPEGLGEPVKYDHRLAAGLGIDVDDKQPARSVLLGIFNGNKVALNVHALQFTRWMGDPTGDHGLGES